MGPAKRRKHHSSKVDDDEEEDFTIPSDVEVEDADLSHFLESNTSFLVNMTGTGAFNVPWRKHKEPV